MSSNPEDRLLHILDEIKVLEEISKKVNRKQFYKDELLKRTAIRCFEVIGEAVKNIPEELKNLNAEINWKGMAKMRDVMIHHYFEVDYEIVWDTIQEDIPGLKVQIKNLLKKLNNA